MKLLNIPFIIITIATIIGVVIGFHISIHTTTILYTFLLSVFVLGISWWQSKKIFSKGGFFLIMTIVVFICFGITLTKTHDPKYQKNHYSAFISSKAIDTVGIRFCIKEVLKPSSFYQKYVVSVRFIENKTAHGSLLLRIPKDSISANLDIGDTYTVYTTTHPIPKPLNPDQFDYASFLYKQRIYHQITIQSDHLISNSKKELFLLRTAHQIRKKINTSLSDYPFTTKQLAVINALLLGQKQSLSQETTNDYKNAGAIHILALSGLHVGILLLVINGILYPLNRFKKTGRTIKLLLTILFLWCFAVIAGLSPSVLRAVTMFSLLSIGLYLRSRASIFNSFFISAFILICFDPFLIHSVGFQLSYTAVFSIIWLQPQLVRLYHPKFYGIKKLWELCTITITAQLGVFPLTLYYFNQFPFLFLLSNLSIIPFLGGILSLGILVIALASLNILPDFIASLFAGSIDIMNSIITWIARQETFVITHISFSQKMLLSTYIIIILTVLIIKQYKLRKLIWLGISATILITTIQFYEKHNASQKEELIIYHNYRNTTLGILKNQKLTLYSKDSITAKTKYFLFDRYLTKNRASIDTITSLQSNYQYKQQNIIIIDSASTYHNTTPHPDIILLSGSPKIHLERLIKEIQPKQVIADASNYRSYIDRWEMSCKKLNILFHRTDKKGAFVLK